jgi:hypothetical protein
MKKFDLELPSNRKFGYFFTFVFILFGVYFYVVESIILSSIFLAVSFLFIIVTIINSEILLPLNKLWMRLGLFIGLIVSPIVLGAIFFGIFTPLSLLMRACGRDELSLKIKVCKTYWKTRNDKHKEYVSFKNQF